MWRAVSPDREAVLALARAREKFDLYPLVIHDNYLINMASCDEALRLKSVLAFRGEIERALAVGAEFLVAHPGSCKGHTVDAAIHTLAISIGEAARGLDTRGLTMLIENTAGSGNILGSTFEELAVMKEHAAGFTDLAIGFCIDTCHCLAAGYMVKEAIAGMGSVLGFDNVHVIHANDSKTPLGSHVDRHENIGRGYIGIEGFRQVLNHSKLRTKAFIAETPVEEDDDDRRDVQTLISLCPKSRMTTKK